MAFDSAESIATYLLGGIMAILSWLGLRQVSRIDDLERNCIRAATCERNMERTERFTASTFTRLEDALREHREETRENFADIRRRLDVIKNGK